MLLIELGDNFTACVKLMLSTSPKERYMMHYSNLALPGAEHVSLSGQPYHQVPAESLAGPARKAPSDFEKNFFELAYSALLGKKMENLRKCINIDFVAVPRISCVV